jgi:hypothetical protein
MIAPGGGLIGAVHQDAGTLSVRRHLSRMMNGGLEGQYSDNRLLDSGLPQALGGFGGSGHAISGTASLDRQLGEHFALVLGYSRLHQSYPDITAISNAPNTNRAWVSFSYQFSRPLGR